MADIDPSQWMRDFALRSGIVPGERPPTRYLWTDAFAVCNFVGLYGETGDEEELDLARRLVDQVHWVLGRHRPDAPEAGWLSGLDEESGSDHPTIGGLRIGKPLPERTEHETHDPRLEWERDGQYFHYLTRWMHALVRMAQATRETTYGRWAMELARTAYAAFARTSADGHAEWLYWKMSIDLRRPLVASMGQHDPLDGWVTFQEVASAAAPDPALGLATEIRGLAELCRGRRWETDDPLGIGGLLCNAWVLARLQPTGSADGVTRLAEMLDAATHGLAAWLRRRPLDAPAHARLAFRELGLSLGLHAARALHGRLPELADRAPGLWGLRERLRRLVDGDAIASAIEGFWSEPPNRTGPAWEAHDDINSVMLATSLAPAGYLGTR